MYIQPNSNIRILHDVPLDNSYEHSLYFEGAIAQSTYFSSKTKYYIQDSQYQRVNNGVMKINIKADNLYDCNYLMFQNESFGSKWFYAFITSVEYINNVTSKITFEIDELQTWHMDYTLNYCFVEREHVESDHIGEHLEDEGLATGEMVYNEYNPMLTDGDRVCVIALVSDSGEGAVHSTLVEGIVSGVSVYAFLIRQHDAINGLITAYAQSYDSIIGLYMCPRSAVGDIASTSDYKDHLLTDIETNQKREIIVQMLTDSATLDGYSPVNNKMYTYPYNYFAIDNGNTTMAYAYEYFEDLAPLFEMNFTITPPIQVMISPKKYKGVGNKTNNNESLTLGSYPICPWVGDAYQAWLAQTPRQIASTGLAIGGAFAFPNVFTGINAINQTVGLLAGVVGAKMNKGISKGTVEGNIKVVSGKQNFYGGRVSVTYNYAKMLDDFFTRFGYKVCRNKIPNRTARPHWNYVKTIGCSITGSIPSDSEKKICSIYDKGITFWKYANEVGNYSDPSSNKPLQSN